MLYNEEIKERVRKIIIEARAEETTNDLSFAYGYLLGRIGTEFGINIFKEEL